MTEASTSFLWSNIITLFAVALGWVLGELTGVIKGKRDIKKKKDALIQELKDCLGWLQRNRITLEYMISLAVLGKIGDFAPVKIPTYIYDKYFPDISIHLTPSERISFNGIHNLIKTSHEQTDNLIKIRQQCIQDQSHKKEFASLLEGIYHNVYLAISLIDYHLKHGKHIDINKLSNEEEDKIKTAGKQSLFEIFKEAKKLGLNGIEKKYGYDD